MEKGTKEMMKILQENKKRIRLEKEEKKARKEQSKRTIITIIILIIVLILLLFIMGKENNDFLTNCTKGGLSESVCRTSM